MDKVTELAAKADSALGGTTSFAATAKELQEATKVAPTGSAVRGASLLIILQIGSRAITFVANQLLLRFLTAQLMGISAQLEVFYLSVLFFARESLRVAVQRHSSSSNEKEKQSGQTEDAADSQSVVNIAHLSLGLGLASTLGLGWAYLHYVDEATASTPYLETALYIYGIAALVELLSEPAFVVLQHRLRFGPRASAESAGTFLRCAITYGAAGWGWKEGLDLGVLPFALGQLGYGVGLLVVYAWYGFSLARAEGFSLLPRPIREVSKTASTDKGYVLGYFSAPTLQLATSMMAQSVVKHILTQGDTFLVSILSNPQAQGVYALANNYGSLLARLVFQPIEESSRNYFSKLLSSTPDEKNDKARIQKSRSDLQALLKFYVLLSVVVVTVGPYAAPLLVQIIAGPGWSGTGAGDVLARYCLYIPFLAFNGVAEAFVSSVATKSQVHRQSAWMGAFSFAFSGAGFVSLRVLDLGASGLVYSNAINMLCRIFWSGVFISEYYRENGVPFGWSEILPNGAAAYVLGTAIFWGALPRMGISVGHVSEHVFEDLIKVGIAALPYVGLIAYAERRYLMDCYLALRSRRGAV